MRPQRPSAAAEGAPCPSAGAGANAAGSLPSAIALPPLVPAPDPWDGARGLGWLVSAAKLVSRHGWGHSNCRGSEEAPSSWGFLSLCGALRSLALGPGGLPALLTELGADSVAAALPAAASGARAEVSSLRAAVRLLPPPAVLGAGPLLPFGAAAAVLRSLAAKGSGGDTAPSAVASAAHHLSESLVAALAELAADQALEPYVRAARAETERSVGVAATVPKPAAVSQTAAVPQPSPPALCWQPPSLDATAGIGVGEVAAAVAAFSPRCAKQLARLRAAAVEAGAGPPSLSPLLTTACGILQTAVDAAALERMRVRLLAGPLLPPPGCRLWPPAVLRVCCNPACGDLTGDAASARRGSSCGAAPAARPPATAEPGTGPSARG
ncbi:hypothetical protein GPECTOR_7g1092 [Gonium pectorale]|uniref:Uncharacterized protein n=1 Tax=Gonium pectorale TaxID=33097 RepID=A0A150GTP5_GONPE|nr:hypothetical protein GPECTOR_7g1092 [Gonium pectorale]|eukprot:KXZ53199.1 hypothetical protein GPECTOR_7g1092 [Gonium pectorale]